jgi:hypothetical protein
MCSLLLGKQREDISCYILSSQKERERERKRNREIKSERHGDFLLVAVDKKISSHGR